MATLISVCVCVCVCVIEKRATAHTITDHKEMKTLKCKTLGGIQQLCTYTSVVYILRMRVRVPRCPE